VRKRVSSNPPIGVALESRLPVGVLLIEDDLASANALHKLLDEVAGRRLWLWHEVSATAARRILTACRFHLILLDLTPPDGPPGVAIRLIKRAAPDTPLALLASPTDVGIDQQPFSVKHARLAGAIAVLPKRETAPLLRVLHGVLHAPRPGRAGPVRYA
jgi:CheY-like chemotaxis protein